MKIAVVVPVYNGEKFLPEFLSCLKRQTMKCFEVFFVDDASTDKTREILQRETAKEHAYHYFRNESRKGAAYSRNRGIESSQSEYVLCLDADDLVADDLIEQLSQAAECFDADMIMLERGDFVQSDRVRRENTFLEDDVMLYEKPVFRIIEQPEDFLIRCQNGTCDRMIKRELLNRHQIRFQDLTSSNDVFYTLSSTFAAERMVHTKSFDRLYYRRVHSEEGRISNSRDPMCAFQALLAVKGKLEELGMWESCCIHFWIFALDSLEKQLFVCKDPERQKEIYQYLQKEGLKLLGVLEDPFFERISGGYQKQFRILHTMPYEEKCFVDSMAFQALCENNVRKISELLDYIERKGIRVGYWGVGRLTKGFLDAVSELGKKVDALIDNNREKQGKFIFGMEIFSFDEVCEKTGLIIVSNKQYYFDIRSQVKNKNEKIEVLSIQEYLQSNLQLEKCLR